MKTPLILFVIVWLVFGFFINDTDLTDYNIFHAGAEAVALRGDFELGKSDAPMLIDAGGYDAFTYNERKLPAKQPGTSLVGGGAYFWLHHLAGFDYKENYHLTAALVTFFSTSLLTALATALFYLTLLGLRFSPAISIIGSLSWAFASMQFPYSTTLHHDALANALLVVCLFFLVKSQKDHKYLYLSGFAAGLTSFISVLPFPVFLGIGFWALLQHRRESWRFVAGAFLGLLPIFIYNSYYFDNPFRNANAAGEYKDTFFDLSGKNLKGRWHDYLELGVVSIWKYFPLLPLGFIGFFRAPTPIRVGCIIGIILQFFYVLNIGSIGTCCYGPRYLLPLTVLASLGIPYLMTYSSKTLSLIGTAVVSIVIIYSGIVYTAGAWGGTVYCHFHGFAARAYLFEEGVPEREPKFPLWQWEKI